MKFIWVIKREWKHPGPIVHVALRNAHALAQAGHECHFILGEGEPSETDWDLQKFYGLDSIKKFHIHRIRRGGVFASRPIIRFAMDLAHRIKDRERITLVTRDTGYLADFAELFSDRKYRTLYEAHDFFTDLSWKGNNVTLQDRRNQLLEKKYLPKISGIISITQAQAELYRAAYPKTPALALPLGTEPQPQGASEDERLAAKTVVYVGHLNTYKGTRDLLKCCGKLQKKLAVKTAFWGGTPTQITRIFTPEKREKYEGFLEFLPFRPPAELAHDLAHRATLGVLPLQDNYYNRNLTCPVKALDYISHGLPVIATDLPTNRWLLQDAAIYYPTDVKKAVYEAVCQALDPQTYAALSLAARRRSRELSYLNRAKSIAKFAKQLHSQD